jgi:hypothetical protein
VSPPLLAVALVAGGALAFEVLLTRILAVVHWHHFAGMVISLALLGYGASGAALTPVLDRLRPHAALGFGAAATLFGLAAVAQSPVESNATRCGPRSLPATRATVSPSVAAISSGLRWCRPNHHSEWSGTIRRPSSRRGRSERPRRSSAAL